jgi:hypothetical protein
MRIVASGEYFCMIIPRRRGHSRQIKAKQQSQSTLIQTIPFASIFENPMKKARVNGIEALLIDTD